MALVCNATTLEELRGEIVALLRHHAWQARAAARIRPSKTRTAQAECAAWELENSAKQIEEMEIASKWPSGLSEQTEVRQ